MARPKVYQTSAVILRQRKLGEADRILTLFSPSHGKFDAVAKGVRRPTSRMGGHLEVLSFAQLLVAAGQNLDIITQVQMVESFAGIRSDLGRLTRALYVAELVDRFTDEREEAPDLFRLLMETLKRLQERDELDLALRYFELRLLGLLGYQPQLYYCVHCSAPLTPGQNYWTATGGGVLCPACQAHEALVRPVSVNALKVLRLMQRAPFPEVARVRISSVLMAELERCLRESIRFLLDRDVRSLAFLETVRAGIVPARQVAPA
jgi:DNA repair protein RecO (recombination protein O)